MFFLIRRRTIHERNVSNSEGGPLGGRGFPSGCGPRRADWLFLRTSSGVGGQHSLAGGRQAGTSRRATHTVAELDERTEPTAGCHPVAKTYRSKSDSRSDRCADRADPPKRTRPSSRNPHAGAETQVRGLSEEPRPTEKTRRLQVNDVELAARSDFYNQFAGIAPGEEHVDSVRRFFQSLDDGFAVLQLPEHFPLTELRCGFHEARGVIED